LINPNTTQTCPRWALNQTKSTMQIKIISPITFRGKQSALYNYAYFADSGEQISATFQATKAAIEYKKRAI